MTKELLEHIDRLIQQRPFCRDTLASYRELVNIMVEVTPRPQSSIQEESFKEIKKEEGFPHFSRDDLPLDFKTSSYLLKMFLQHLETHQRDDREGLKKALEKARDDLDWSGNLFKAVLKKDDKKLSKTGKEVDLNPKVLQFLAQVALRPSLQELRHSLCEKIENKGWDYGYCPVCGSQPNMAYLDRTGKRLLHCELCGEEWPYPRLNCPFCRNEDQKSLGYFYSEREEGVRVDFCRKCHRYIKTIDTRSFENSAPMELEYLATIHLDILANENGFK